MGIYVHVFTYSNLLKTLVTKTNKPLTDIMIKRVSKLTASDLLNTKGEKIRWPLNTGQNSKKKSQKS